MSIQNGTKVVGDSANKLGNVFDPALDICPKCKDSLCIIASEENLSFPCSGGQFNGCTQFLRWKKGEDA